MNRIGAALLALGAMVALYFLVLHSGSSSDIGSEDVEGTEDSGSPIAGEDDANGASEVTDTRGPVLFTTGKKRSGKGGLRGQLKWFDSGKPAPALRVKIAGRGRKGEAIDFTLTTGDRGSFSVADVPASDDLVILAAAGTEHERTLPLVAVEPDAVSDLGVVWLGQRGLLEGIVTDVEGNPIAGAEVRVHEGFGSMLEAASQMMDLIRKLDQPVESQHTTLTKADGTYAIPDVPPGSIVVVAQATGYEAGVEQTIKASQGTADRIDISLAPGVSMQGVVVDKQGRGIAEARVVVIQQQGMLTGFLARSFATTDGLGRFELTVPPGGAANLGAMVAANRYPSSLFEVQSVAQPQRFELIGGAEMRLRVIEADSGKPLAEADIMAFVGDDEEIQEQPKTLISAVTDENGYAEFFAQPGVMQMLWVKHPRIGAQIYAKGMGAAMGNAAIQIDDTSIKPGSNQRTVKINVGTRVFGFVKSTEGAPIAGARVRGMGMMGVSVDTLSDAEGRYECMMSGAMMMGLVATAPGWIQKMDPADLPGMENEDGGPGKENERDIVMEPAVSVAGRVVGPDGAPVSGARVRLSADKGGAMMMMSRMFQPNAEAVTTTNGRYLLDGVSAGAKGARVMVRCKGYIDSQSKPFEVAATGTTQAGDVTLRRGVSVVVKVTDRRGDAVGRATLEVDTSPTESVNFDAMGGFMDADQRTTNAAGKVTLHAMPPGGLTVTASGSGFAATRGELVLEADAKEPYTLEITLREAVPIKGRVVDPDGKPIKGASVSTREGDVPGDDANTWIPRVSVESASDGRFTLEGLPEITLMLDVGAKGFLDGRVEVIGANRSAVEARLQKRDAGVQREIEKVEAELQEIYGKFGSAKGAEQKRLIAELQRLQTKLQRLKGDSEEGIVDEAEEAPLPMAEDDG